MKPCAVLVTLIAVTGMAAGVLAGCGKQGADAGSSSGGPSPSGSGGVATVSQYDSGPRAADMPVDESKVAQGKDLFQTKGCSACHAFGRRISCPDLAGVTRRRTAAWMENQILHPEVMTKQDPIAHSLFAQYSLQMPNQGLTPDQARAVIEFFKHTDRDAGTAAAK